MTSSHRGVTPLGWVVYRSPARPRDGEREPPHVSPLAPEGGGSAQFTTQVVVQRNRIPRTRAKFDEWAVTFVIEADEELVDSHHLREWFSLAGRRIGLGDWRPEKSGDYGRFAVTEIARISGQGTARRGRGRHMIEEQRTMEKNWVTEWGSCTADCVLEDLHQVVEADVQAMNDILKRRQSGSHHFKTKNEGSQLIVGAYDLRRRDLGRDLALNQVSFTRYDERSLEVTARDVEGFIPFVVTWEWNSQQLSRLLTIDGTEATLQDISRKALMKLFGVPDND